MHITRKALIAIIICLLIVFIGYEYYRTLNKEETKMATQAEGLVSVRVGETMSVDGLSVSVRAITEDSRCPADVQCIQAGAVAATVTLMTEGNATTTSLTSLGNPVMFEGYQVFMQNVLPPKEKGTLDSASYIFTFHVKKN